MLNFDELWNVDAVDPMVKGARVGGIKWNGVALKLYDMEGTDKKTVSLSSLTRALIGRSVPKKAVEHIVKGITIPCKVGRHGDNKMTVLDAHDAIKVISYYREVPDTEGFEAFVEFFKENVFDKLVQ